MRGCVWWRVRWFTLVCPSCLSLSLFFLPSLSPSRMIHICHPSVRSGKINPNPLETTLSLSDSQLFDTNIYNPPDSHVIKSIRSLAHYASLLGNSPPGGLPGTYKEEGRGVDKEEAVKGMSKLDGSVFLRAAGAIMTTMAPGGEGAWDRSQLGYDEAWE